MSNPDAQRSTDDPITATELVVMAGALTVFLGLLMMVLAAT